MDCSACHLTFTSLVPALQDVPCRGLLLTCGGRESQAFRQPQTSTGSIPLVGRELDLVDINIGVHGIQTRPTFGLELASSSTSLCAKM